MSWHNACFLFFLSIICFKYEFLAALRVMRFSHSTEASKFVDSVSNVDHYFSIYSYEFSSFLIVSRQVQKICVIRDTCGFPVYQFTVLCLERLWILIALWMHSLGWWNKFWGTSLLMQQQICTWMSLEIIGKIFFNIFVSLTTWLYPSFNLSWRC